MKKINISIWRLSAYFIIYCFIGYIIETVFGIITKGVLESRQSFLYGPFLGLYGIGAVIITLLSQKIKKNKITLFLGGFIIGAITEFFSSFLIELVMKTRWWDYSDYILNINGRICLLYSMFWGLLTPLVIKTNIIIDKIINKIKEKISIKILKIFTILFILFLIFDCILTCYAQKQFINRMIVQNNIEVEDKEKIIKEFNNTYENEFLANIIITLWNDEKMLKTFPNIKIEDINHNTIYLDSLLPNIQPYYMKFFNK